MYNVLIINGPNLNLLGQREPDIYGTLTLKDINKMITDHFKESSVHIDFFQSNYEGDIITKIQESVNLYSALVINPGAYSHYSIAILDAIRSIKLPVIEIHLSNIYSRESYRNTSITSSGCVGVLSGFGYYGYIMAVDAIIQRLDA